jgi:hypothetical protein
VKILTAKNNANTDDIIYHLCMAAPAAIAQVKKMNLAEIIGLTGSNVQRDGKLAGKWIRAEIKYKMDGYDNQNIQFPSALLKSKNGDCKSLSLLYLAIMENAGYNGGFRFASYRPNGKFTHVYNYFLDKSNKKFIFDACSKNLNENKNYKSVKDMRVNYLAGAPVMFEDVEKRPVQTGFINGVPVVKFLDTGEIISAPEYIGRKRLKDRINDKWKQFQKNNPKLADTIKKGVDTGKKVSLAPSRAAFLTLLAVNARGYSSKIKRWMDKDPDAAKKLWEGFGGDFNIFKEKVAKAAARKPLFGEKRKRGVSGYNYAQDYVGVEPVTTAASSQAIIGAIAAAAPIIAALLAALKKAGIKDTPEETPPADDEGLPPLPDDPLKDPKFIPIDPESEEAAAYTRSGGKVFVNTQGQVTTPGSNLLNPKNILIFGGVAVAAFLLLKKKK